MICNFLLITVHITSAKSKRTLLVLTSNSCFHLMAVTKTPILLTIDPVARRKKQRYIFTLMRI